MDLRSSSITADILNFLSDGKLHTLSEIAKEIEVHKNTVYKHIQSLSYRYPIQTFCGKHNAGVKLDTNYIHQGRILTKDELQLINKALTLLQKNESDVNNPTLCNLIKIFNPPNNEEKIYGREQNWW